MPPDRPRPEASLDSPPQKSLVGEWSAQATKSVWPGVLFILFATLAAYWPVFSAGFIWDDDDYVTDNPMLSAPDGWWRIWFSAHHQSQYFPIVYSTLRLEYAMWGLQPMGYHVVNVCLHIGNSLLVWKLLRELAVPGAWLAAAVFALHPVQVESVAWVTELKNTESTLFFLLALLVWLKFCGGRSRWFYALALVLYALALFAKTTACTLPAVLLLVLWLKEQPITWRRAAQVMPFLLLGIGMGLLSIWWEKHLDNYESRYHLLGGFPDRLLIATHAVWFYAGKIFWPRMLTFSYPRWTINPADAAQYLWLAGGVAVVTALWLWRAKWGRGPLAAVIFFVAVLSPMLGFIPLYTFYFSYVADHYQYLACLGLIALVSAAVAAWRGRHPQRATSTGLVLMILVITLGILTRQQCRAYQDLETLWNDTLAKNPRSWMAHTNLGRLEAQRGLLNAAETNYLAALQINPDSDDTCYNYANLLARTGRPAAAEAQYEQTLQLNPGKADAHNNLGALLLNEKRAAEAIAQYRLAIQLNPEAMSYHYNLASALAADHQTDQAVAEFQRALELAPDSELIKRRLRALGVAVN